MKFSGKHEGLTGVKTKKMLSDLNFNWVSKKLTLLTLLVRLQPLKSTKVTKEILFQTLPIVG